MLVRKCNASVVHLSKLTSLINSPEQPFRIPSQRKDDRGSDENEENGDDDDEPSLQFEAAVGVRGATALVVVRKRGLGTYERGAHTVRPGLQNVICGDSAEEDGEDGWQYEK
uniref:Uncharacterized protein n=1 Tax=Steinernema glaseri TaxID=37863 RepID=A0A1I7Z6E8_9BILA